MISGMTWSDCGWRPASRHDDEPRAAPAAVDDAASIQPPHQAVVGLDAGDRQSHYCVLDLSGGVVAEGVVKTTEASLWVLFEGKGRMRIALEAGTHSPWISRLLLTLGHEVFVANPAGHRAGWSRSQEGTK
jgi:hypothetical protein